MSLIKIQKGILSKRKIGKKPILIRLKYSTIQKLCLSKKEEDYKGVFSCVVNGREEK